jgi:hypothetical protein
MSYKWYVECLPFFLIGAYLVITAIVSKTLISESDVPATEAERARAKATPRSRLLFVAFGLACIIYALLCSRS